MSGIAGWVATARRAGDEELLVPMAAALRHRAAGGGALCGVVETNARRQLVLAASLRDPVSGISVAVDGSIVNASELRAQLEKHGYRFRGQSEDELVLRAYQRWDKQLLRQLRGAFAFALWDGRRERLLLARDRFGEKPLYLHERDGAVYFASEIKALIKAGIRATVDVDALWECLSHRYVPGPRTLFAGIRKLVPGSYALWQHGKLHEARYWSAPDGAARPNAPANRPLEGFVAALEEAVRLRPAEGVLLSGGLDSAVLLALAAANGAPLKTFSLAFARDKRSELASAAQAARQFGAQHHEVVVAPEDLVAHLEYLIACRDAPVPRASELALCRLASEAAQHVKSVLTGDGCDEVLGGYRRYVAQVVCGAVDAFPARLFAPLVSAGRFDTAAAALKLKRHREQLVPNRVHIAAASTKKQGAGSRLRRALHSDQITWLPDQLLERNDRAAAATALELRMPYLDHCLVEYVSALPDSHRVRGLTTKRILRQAAGQLLPLSLARRVKAGLRLDVAAWLRGELRDFTLEHLQGPSSLTRQYYDAATLDRVLDEHLKGKNNYETLLWTLLNLEIWHRTYRPG